MLASEGARVFVCGRSKQHLIEALQAIAPLGEADGVALDLANKNSVARFFDAAEKSLGGIDAAIVNAAVAASGLTEEGKVDLHAIIATDFTAYLDSCREAAVRMGNYGDICMIGSMSTYALGPHSTVYAGIKYGIQGFAVALRRELGPKGIRVSLVEPSRTGSDMQLPDISPKKQRDMIEAHEMLRAEDIAVGIHYVLTQPRRTVIQRLDITPRLMIDE
ncbi:SDR family oxidoreductase [Sphingomonas panacisoli]|uniref:SDR family oxidoreductase n=1 Tax=Sphingomonas panacisoli TaxID=1813879 RepID=UPI0016481878|nr:SDR family oxidoreductase [Sphingomonas panacisoli]